MTSSGTEAAAAGGGKSRTSTLDIPNVVQLYTKNPILVEKNSKTRTFSVLSYQTVHVASSAAEEGGALLSNLEKEATSLHPNLGVWNCRITKARSGGDGENQQPLSDDIFRTLPSSHTPPAICMAVDFSNLAEVEPSISLLQGALVRYLIDRQSNKDSKTTTNTSPTATTSLFALRSTNFGLAVNDEESAKSMSSSAPDESDKNVRISLAISVMLPSRASQTEGSAESSSGDGYKEKQAEALVLYHLRKYAASLNAVLCFVRKEKPTEEETKAVDALTLNQLSFVWQQLAKGEEGWKELDATQGEKSDQTAVSGIYGPGAHHEDLIESVLLRNAQFPGRWDAGKDSLWVALPPPESETKDEIADESPTGGDEDWLNELRASVASDVKEAPAKEVKKTEAADDKKDADVSDFFNSLLKP